MKIYGKNGTQVGELERPEPVEQNGIWYEAVEYREVKSGDMFLDEQNLAQKIRTAIRRTFFAYWIMQPIPRATPEQLNNPLP